ncbi:UV-B-induced protein At3g17800, chloroplastic [Selaginella moellendorffii]|uniref:UV-B-induced protein At3g17800, chloroplastic n=1 Tax=Selaginella moellendorffii TaxID=88036 RepID=UPI000D1C7106|nr:UV-B-induced protein At3g17800, chloroplastic [Selaginella moellendorffii]|eukprot:XP_024537765.1 UV-B-induced protein At3g17800, chloroplastic [Selaginella moellendorffii]
MAAVQVGSSSSGGFASSSYRAQQSSVGAKRSIHFTASTSFFGKRDSLRIKNGFSRPGRGPCHIVKAQSGRSSATSMVGPWEPESPIGQFLVSLLQSHPHLFLEAAEQHIQQLAADKNAAAEKSTNSSGSELVLYKRIAEVKEQERQKAVVEVIYSLVVQKFLDSRLALVPKIPSLPANQKVDTNWQSVQGDMESIHSAEVLEVVRDHLGMILGRPSPHYQEPYTLVQASKMKIGHLYAATVVFGYFLRRLDQRYQLDLSMKKALSSDKHEDEEQGVESGPGVSEELDFKTDAEGEKLAAEANAAVQAMQAAKSSTTRGGLGGSGVFPQLGWKPSKLKSYVMSLDPESLQRFATLRCKESLDVVERQTQALFGKPEAEIAPDGSVVLLAGDSFTISLSGLRRLVTEAVVFGSFLWDAEAHVDSHYNLVG